MTDEQFEIPLVEDRSLRGQRRALHAIVFRQRMIDEKLDPLLEKKGRHAKLTDDEFVELHELVKMKAALVEWEKRVDPEISSEVKQAYFQTHKPL